MKEKIKKILLLLALSILFSLITLPVDNIEAISGACSWHGGVNCAAGPDWDGSVICNDGWRDSSVSYSSMVKCRGYGYDYPSPSIPDCPLHSYYDSISDSCKCYSGYVVSGGKCISTDQYCRDLLGWNARYNILTDSCECDYGYVLSGGRCVDGDTLCHQQFGYNSRYDSLLEVCECKYGYRFDSNDQCVSENDYCQDLYGFNAEYDTLTDRCVCKKGYVVDSTKTRCIDGDTYCRDKYGIHSNFDYWDESCECDSGYIFSGNKCVHTDTYCQNLYGFHSNYNILTKQCECDYGYKLKSGECVKLEVSKISPPESKEEPIVFREETSETEILVQENRPQPKPTEEKSEAPRETIQTPRQEEQVEDQPNEETVVQEEEEEEEENEQNPIWILLANFFIAAKSFFSKILPWF